MSSPKRQPLAIGTPAVLAALALLPWSPQAARAHVVEQVPTLATAWSLTPWLLVPGLLSVAAYAWGAAWLWRRAGVGRGLDVREALLFTAGVGALFLSLVWPLDAYGGWSLAAHMAQHMLLLALAPPLLLLGRPVGVLAQVMPTRWTRGLHRAAGAGRRWSALNLGAASVAHSAAMWIWHVPAATALALASELIHWAMHASFLLAGLWFWSALLRAVRDTATGAGAALVAMVAIMMQMGLMGALMVFARRPLYPVYAERAPLLGLDPIADQQLAGLIMWVPACLPYLIGGLWLMALGLRRLERTA